MINWKEILERTNKQTTVKICMPKNIAKLIFDGKNVINNQIKFSLNNNDDVDD